MSPYAPRMNPLRAAVAIALLMLTASTHAASAPSISGRDGAVASADPLATQAGLDILRRGGNAADAAVATALVLAVVYPEAGNLGGGGFAVSRFGDAVEALDFREVAPAAATKDMYLDEKGEPRGDASLVGALSAGVPGSPAGLFELQRKYGKLPWKSVVAPALKLARDGFPVSGRLAADASSAREMLVRFPSTAALFLPRGEPLVEGAILRLPELARTLSEYAAGGSTAIMTGRTAKDIADCCAANGGIITLGDMVTYRPTWREPVRFTMAGWSVASMPLPSSGGTILAMSSAMLERLQWRELPRFGAERAHLEAETWRRAYAARYALGDPTTTQLETTRLVDARTIGLLVGSIQRTRATPSSEVHAPTLPSTWTWDKPQTTHLSVVDSDGNAVSLTTTLNGSFGSGLVVPGAGFLMNNEMDDFTTAPGKPNVYGLIQGDANAVRPGKRMLSSMSPTIAWNEQGLLALGSPGGSQIPTSTLQVMLNLLVDGDDLQAAVDRPRIHHQWMPDEIVAEADALSPETLAELERRAHHVRLVRAVGEVHAVRRFTNGHCEAAADPRGPGSAGVVAAGAR